MSPLELATAAVAQQAALLQDARTRLDVASGERVRCERAVSDAEAAHANAMRASSASRSDSGLLDDAARAAIRLEHAKRDHAEAIEAHTQAGKDVASAEARVTSAQQAKECAAGLEQLSAHDAALRDLGEQAGKAFLQFRAVVFAIDDRLRTAVALAERVRELGGESAIPDGCCAAGGFLRAMGEAGAAMGGDQHHTVRYAFCLPVVRNLTADENVRAVFAVALDLLEQGRRLAAVGASYGAEALSRVAEVYSRSRNARAALDELEAKGDADERERQARDRAAHQERLDSSKAIAGGILDAARLTAYVRKRELDEAQAHARSVAVDHVPEGERSLGDGETVMLPSGETRTVRRAVPPDDLPPHPSTRPRRAPTVG
jgi:hypothetical protein